MTQTTSPIYQEVVKLTEMLSQADKDRLMQYLREKKQEQALSLEEWWARLEAVRYRIAPGPNFSDRRQDWYDDDGR